MKGYWNSDKLIFTSTQHKPTYGWKATLKRYKESYPNKASMGKLEFKILNISLESEKKAKLKGEWRLIRQPDNPSGKFWLDLNKFDRNWLIIKVLPYRFKMKNYLSLISLAIQFLLCLLHLLDF